VSKRTAAAAALASIAFLSLLFYRGGILSFVEMLLMEQYSYLLILFPTSAWMIADLVKRHSTMRPPGILKASSLFGGILIASAFLLLSRIPSDHSLELELLSLAVASSSIIIIAFSEFDGLLIPATIFFLLLILVPLPGWVFGFSPTSILDPMASIASSLTGISIVSEKGAMGIEAPGGGFVQIAPQLNSIAVIAAALSTLPLIFYLALRSSARVKEKILAVAKAAAASLLTVIGGTFLRILLVFILTKSAGSGAASQLFLFTPTFLFGALALFASVAAIRSLPPPKLKPKNAATPSGERDLALKLAYLSLTIVIFSFLSLPALNLGSPSTELKPDPSELFGVPQSSIESARLRQLELESLPIPAGSGAFSQYAAYVAVIDEGNATVYSIIEIAGTPSSFIPWSSILSSRGFYVEQHWVEDEGNSSASFIIATSLSSKVALAYLHLGLPLSSEKEYARITLISPITGENQSASLNEIRSLLKGASLLPQEGIQYRGIEEIAYLGILIAVLFGTAGLVHSLRGRRSSELPVQKLSQ